MSLAFGCCVGSWDRFTKWVAPSAFGPVVAMSGQDSICTAYNSIINAVDGQDIDALVLMHDDLELTDPDAEAKIRKAIEDPSVAIVGIGGGRGVCSIAWWDRSPLGHQMTDSGIVDFGQRTGDVDYIDGSFMILTRWAMQNLRFDEQYQFHGYEDICLSATAKGKRVVVAGIDTHHHTGLGFRSPEVHEKWLAADALFKRKWGL